VPKPLSATALDLSPWPQEFPCAFQQLSGGRKPDAKQEFWRRYLQSGLEVLLSRWPWLGIKTCEIPFPDGGLVSPLRFAKARWQGPATGHLLSGKSLRDGMGPRGAPLIRSDPRGTPRPSGSALSPQFGLTNTSERAASRCRSTTTRLPRRQTIRGRLPERGRKLGIDLHARQLVYCLVNG